MKLITRLRGAVAALLAFALVTSALHVTPALADSEFNIAKGRTVEFVNRVDSNDPTNAALVVIALKTCEAESTLIDYDSVSAVLAGSNTEADFTNYARKVLTDSDITFGSPDDTNDWYAVDIPDQTWSSAGGATDNTLCDVVIAYDNDSTAGDDTNLIPLTVHAFARTTTGADLVFQVNPGGFFRAK